MSKKIVFLNNIRSAHNVGAIFRTADGAGVSTVYLGGYTPTPIDRFGRVQAEIKKTSLGASASVPYTHVPTGTEIETLRMLQQDGYQIVAVEQTATAISLHTFAVPENVVYVFGNEVTGVDESILTMVDEVVHIPMFGTKESLNVATTVGIVTFWPGVTTVQAMN